MFMDFAVVQKWESRFLFPFQVLTEQGALRIVERWTNPVAARFLKILPDDLEAKWISGPGLVPHFNVFTLDTQLVRRHTVMKVFPDVEVGSWHIEIVDTGYLSRFKMPIIPWAGIEFAIRLAVPPDSFVLRLGVHHRRNHVSRAANVIFRKIVTYYGRNKEDPDRAYKLSFFTPEFSPRVQLNRELREAGVSSLVDFLGSLPGRKKLTFQPSIDGGCEIAGLGCVQTIVWLPPWALEAFGERGYRELDCSFRGAAPYVYCVPQFIRSNVSLPIGLVIAPTESSMTYRLYEELLNDYCRIRGYERPRYPVLSDQGGAIGKFCKEHGIEHFLCHRHILESLGSGSCAAHLAKPLLECLTNQEIAEHMPQFASDVSAYANAGRITRETMRKLEKLFGATFQSDEHGNLLPDVCHGPETARIMAGWAIPARVGVNRCSNHAEVFHRHVNASTAGGHVSLARHLRNLVSCVGRARDSFNHRLRKQLQKKVREMRRAAEKRHEEGLLIRNAGCVCARSIQNGRLYNTRPFCIHAIHTMELEDLYTDRYEMEFEGLMTKEMVIEQSDERWELAKKRGSEHWAIATGCVSGEAMGWDVEDTSISTSSKTMTRMIRSLAQLLQVATENASDLLMDYAQRRGLRYDAIVAMSEREISTLKLEVTAYAETWPVTPACHDMFRQGWR